MAKAMDVTSVMQLLKVVSSVPWPVLPWLAYFDEVSCHAGEPHVAKNRGPIASK